MSDSSWDSNALTCLLRAARMLINARACAGGLGAAGTAASAAARVLKVAASAGRPPPALRAALRLGGKSTVW